MNYFVSVKTYGDIHAEKKILIISPHINGDWKDFLRYLETPSQIVEIFSEDLLTTFNNIEKDTGASELSHEIARMIVHSIHCCVYTLEIKTPRALLDLNRTLSTAISPLFRDEVNLNRELAVLYWEIRSYIEPYLQECNLFLDIHTMASHSPKNLPEISCKTLDCYIKAYHNAYKNGIPRADIQMITHTPKGNCLAYPKLVSEMAKHLACNNYSIAYEFPYSLAPWLLSTYYARKSSGITVDVNKAVLSENLDQFDLANIDIDQEKVRRMAFPIALGAIESLSQSEAIA